MPGRLELEIGAQSRAAGAIHERLPRVQAALEDLAEQVGVCAPGFRGAAAGGLAEALDAWFTEAAALPPLLAAYAGNLAAVDQRTAGSEERSSAGYQSLAARMGEAR